MNRDRLVRNMLVVVVIHLVVANGADAAWSAAPTRMVAMSAVGAAAFGDPCGGFPCVSGSSTNRREGMEGIILDNVLDLKLNADIEELEHVDLSAGLSAHWAFDAPPEVTGNGAATGGFFADSSGHGRAAQAHGDARLVERLPRRARNGSVGEGGGEGSGSPCGRALDLGSQAAYLVVANSTGVAGLDLGSSFTFALWLRWSGGAFPAWQTLFDNGSSGKFNPAFGVRLLGGTLAVDFYGADASAAAPLSAAVAHNYPYKTGGGSNSPKATARSEVALPAAGGWTHVAFTLRDAPLAAAASAPQAAAAAAASVPPRVPQDRLQAGRSQVASFYIGGELVFREDLAVARRCGRDRASPCTAVDVQPPVGPLWIGQEAPGHSAHSPAGFNGQLDDIRIYGQRALSEGEVRLLHARLGGHCV